MSNGMTNGKLLQEIYERVVRLDEWRISVDEKIDEIRVPLKRVEPLATKVSIQWWLIGVLFVAYVVRLFM